MPNYLNSVIFYERKSVDLWPFVPHFQSFDGLKVFVFLTRTTIAVRFLVPREFQNHRKQLQLRKL